MSKSEGWYLGVSFTRGAGFAGSHAIEGRLDRGVCYFVERGGRRATKFYDGHPVTIGILDEFGGMVRRDV